MLTLIRPLVNEKSMALTKQGFFCFEVGKQTNKNQIEKLIEDKFKVHVLAVRIINQKGKLKNQSNRKGVYTTSGMKKAIVKLKKGEKIGLFEVAGPDKESEETVVRTIEGEEVTRIKEKKSLLRGTKVKVEKNPVDMPKVEEMHTQQAGKTKGEK